MIDSDSKPEYFLISLLNHAGLADMLKKMPDSTMCRAALQTKETQS